MRESAPGRCCPMPHIEFRSVSAAGFPHQPLHRPWLCYRPIHHRRRTNLCCMQLHLKCAAIFQQPVMKWNSWGPYHSLGSQRVTSKNNVFSRHAQYNCAVPFITRYSWNTRENTTTWQSRSEASGPRIDPGQRRYGELEFTGPIVRAGLGDRRDTHPKLIAGSWNRRPAYR
jgi:hypothetical protein